MLMHDPLCSTMPHGWDGRVALLCENIVGISSIGRNVTCSHPFTFGAQRGVADHCKARHLVAGCGVPHKGATPAHICGGLQGEQELCYSYRH